MVVNKIKYLLIICAILNLISCKSHKSNSTNNTENHTSENKTIKRKYAEILGVDASNIKNTKLYEFINDWYGVPYKYAGKDKKGIDCSGLTSTLYGAVYNKKISPSTKILIDEVHKIKQSDLKEGDLVFFNIETSKPSHVGVYLQNNKFVHASSKKGVMISDLNEPYFKKYFHSAGRVK